MSDLGKNLRDVLKKNIDSFHLNGFQVTWKNNSYLYFKGEEEVAQIGFAFVSEKQSEVGSEFGVYVAGSVNGGEIKALLDSISLSYPPKTLPVQCFYRSSLEFTGFPGIQKNGLVSVFANRDLESFADILIGYAAQEIFPDVGSVLLNSPNLKGRIFDHAARYRYPIAQIVFNHLVHSSSDERTLKQEILKSKIYGSKGGEVDEVFDVIKKYLARQ